MRSVLAFSGLMVVLVLGGCISSDKPLLSETRAALPLKNGTYVGGAAHDPEAMRDTVTIKRRLDDYLITKVTPPGKDEPLKKDSETLYAVRFQELDEEHYVAQVHEIKKIVTPYEYLFVHVIPDGAVMFYVVRCDRFLKSGRILKAYDMVPDAKKAACQALSSGGLVAFMREVPLLLGEATELRYVVEKPK